MMRFCFDGNFNTIDQTYSLFGNDLYYIKYNGDHALRDKWSSKHFATVLSHESFHYYMQNQWVEGSRFFDDRMPYETGAILCLLMDKLEVPDWQGVLNHQTKGTQGGSLFNV